ncbi:B-cell receptor CD22-like [Salminus brasiliensis]|uniref:B-cell receptor CD22-like n=1 Tax=Salminus brasiliensis TaxID=930266 RepID=UPI003B82E27F
MKVIYDLIVQVKVMMSLRVCLTVPLLFLIFISGAVAQYWSVIYKPTSICALKGSTVNMDCTYTYPSGHTIQKIFWTKFWPSGEEPPDLLEDPEYRDRVQDHSDKTSNSRLILRDVREKDQRKYYFRFLTDEGETWQGKDGVDLSVTDLQVEVPERVIEGGKVTLTCKTTCSLTDRPTFTWYRNGAPLSSRTDQLHLQSVSREDAGRYHCAVEGQELHSPEVTLNVLYLQVEVPERVIEGGKVTLTCKPSLTLTVRPTFTWYRNGAPLSSRTDQLHLQSVSREDADRYHCAVEDLKLHSPEVTLNVRYPPKSVSVSISPSGEIVEGSSVTLTCSSDGNPPVQKYTWFKGTSLVATGETFTMKKISSVNSGGYKCRSSNEHGEKSSDTVTLDVLYPPKSISVSISPSGEIVEGSSVTLTCSSDGNPPVQKYTWFKKVDKGVLQKWTNQIYSITNIRSADSGEYQCMATNTQGSQSSESKSLTVLCKFLFCFIYPPKSVSVSISPSGEIVEGSSVTLTCSSDGNPPVQKYTWFKKVDKEVLQKWTNQIYSITNISSADGGEYQCMATNTQGSRSSGYKSLTVLYAPKKVWMFISESALSSSVTLTCSSDANPPVQNYTWFKEGGGSPVGSGHSYSALQSGSYYCVAQNTYGSQTAAAVTVTLEGVNGVKSIGLYAAVGVSAGCLLVIGVIVCVRRKRRGDSADDANIRQNTVTSAASDSTPEPDPSNQDDGHYANVVPLRLKHQRNAGSSAIKTSSSGTVEEVQYASVQHHPDKVVKKTEEDDVQYASVKFTRTGAAGSSTASILEDPSVIYSSMK